MDVLANVVTQLLSRLAGTQLGIVGRLDTVSDAKQAIINQYRKQFRGLGYMREDYYIQLKLDTQPYAVYSLRSIPLPLRFMINDEIYRLLSLRVIERVDAEWCTLIFVALKGPVIRPCVDLFRLNDSVMSEHHIQPSVDQVLA